MRQKNRLVPMTITLFLVSLIVIGTISAKEPDGSSADMESVYFNTDKFSLTPLAREVLDRNVERIKSAGKHIVLNGHTDERASAEYNIRLSNNRARAVMDYLISKGVPANLLSIMGYGKRMPVALGHSEEAWWKNRRVEFLLGTGRPGEPAPAEGEKPKDSGEGYTDPVTGANFVFVKGGCYRMGDNSSEDNRAHRVCVNDFYIGRYEVTQEQWQKLMVLNPSYFTRCWGNNCPVEQVSWTDVQDFIKVLNSKSDGKFRLPTEAEWEYAARGRGRDDKYAGGNDVDKVAWYYENSVDKTHPIGLRAANNLGIYDMSGNVAEWVQDWYGDYSTLQNNPTGLVNGTERVVRGGSWVNKPQALRVAGRDHVPPYYRLFYLGFRLARTP